MAGDAVIQSLLNGKPSGNMGRLYVIRHGTTALNAQDGSGPDRIRGWSDVPLSEKGRDEVHDLAERLKDSGIDSLYYSTLSRAHDTAAAIAQKTGARMIPTPGLRPWNVGIYTGKESQAAHPILMQFATQQPDMAMPNGESFNQFKHRVMDTLGNVVNHAGGDSLPAIVTHHRVERLINAWKKAGEPPDRSVDFDTMFHPGEKTAHAELMKIDPSSLRYRPPMDKMAMADHLLADSR